MKHNTLRLSIASAVLITLLGAAAIKTDYFEINKQLELFTGVFKEVNLFYVDDTAPGQLMEKAIEGMLKELDPYTVYIPESRVEDFRMIQTGQYGGIGSTIVRFGENVYIAEPHEGSPADKAGLKAGDWIKAVDGSSMIGKSTEEVSRILKGSPGKVVELVYERNGKEQKLTLKREEIQLKSVPFYGMVNENTGYIYLTSFTEKAGDEVENALVELKKNEKMTQVILDLRSNPGGLLNEAVNVANIFVNKGTDVVSTKGRLKDIDKTYKTLRNAIDSEIPLAVLIDRGSASASEIVAGTIQDLDRGVVVGQRSYGKGLVQQSHPLQYGSQIKLTIAKYYTPSGRCIQAINYAERAEDGSVARIPDSLRTEFKTRNGRNVYDGGGVDPDINVENKEASGILISLLNNGHIFNYATRYVNTHNNIAEPGKFKLTDADYADFVNYLNDKHYAYNTQTEKRLNELKAIADREAYDGLLDEIGVLEKNIAIMKSNDIHRHKNQIKSYLELEIVGRYYYQAGKIRQSLEEDVIVLEAINTLSNENKYKSILSVAR